MKQYQRLITIAAATVAGLAGTLALASPASARDGDTSPYAIDISGDWECLPDGSRLVTWTVENERVSDAATITAVSVLPAGTTIDLGVGDTIAADSDIDAHQVVPGDAPSAKLDVTASWPRIEQDPATDSESLTQTFEGTCTPKYTVTQDCTGITFTFPAVPGGGEFPPPPVDVSLIPSTGDSQIFQRKANDPEKVVTFPGSTGLTVALSYGDDFKKTYTWTSAPCPVPDLPLTGSSLTGPAVIGGSLLVVGIALIVGLFLFRRRRSVANG